MRIRLAELRKIVRNVLTEAEAPTVSAELSPDEKELKSKYPTWGKGEKIAQDSPAKVKAKQVAAILQKKGLTQNAENMKKVKQDLLPALEKMDPTDLFTADPQEIADQFAAKFLN